MLRLVASLLLASVGATTVSNAPRDAPPSPGAPLPPPSGWSATVDHPFFPLRPGTVFVYAPRAGTRGKIDSVTVTHEKKVILGIPAIVVRDRATDAGVLVEDTRDWYAQDKDGNVWYLGEDTREYRNGKLVSTAGSWEAGRKGAQPGVIMKAHPRVGDTYRQEYLRQQAEDRARVLSLSEKATVPHGTFAPTLMIEEWSPLEPGVKEHKYYARGVGLVLQRTVSGGSGEMVLVKVINP